MKTSITLVLVLIAFTGLSQSTSKDSLVCFNIAQATQIANKLATLAVCREDVANKQVIIQAYTEQVAIMRPQLAAKQNEIERLTIALNDCNANEQALKRKRIWWGVGGVIIGIFAHQYLTK